MTLFSEDYEVHLTKKEASEIDIAEIAKDCEIEISDVNSVGHFLIEFEGRFGFVNDKLCAFVQLDWYRKYWDYPMGLMYHMDLMKRLAEFRSIEFDDISDIEFSDDGDWCHLYFTINLKTQEGKLIAAYQESLNLMKWIDDNVNSAQEQIGIQINDISQTYSKARLLELPDLLEKLKIATADKNKKNEKGQLLEELSVRFFSKINGLKVIERIRTKTEEIDLVILNKCNEGILKSESPLILAECKNWTTKKAGKNEYVAFREKLINRRSRAKLGFFISGLGYAKTFFQEDLRNSKDDILIIPLEVDDIIEVLKEAKPVLEFIEKKYVEAGK
jgi:hypothetical protein